MRNRIPALVVLLLSIACLTQCNHKQKEKLEGVWRLQSLEVNGTVIGGKSLGDWKWEFNEEGGYLTDVAGAREKGLYTLKGDKLTLKSVTHEERPEQKLQIIKLDSVELNLVSVDTGPNKSSLHFIKMKARDYEEEND